MIFQNFTNFLHLFSKTSINKGTVALRKILSKGSEKEEKINRKYNNFQKETQLKKVLNGKLDEEIRPVALKNCEIGN